MTDRPIEDDPTAVCMHELHPAQCSICKYGLKRGRSRRRTKGFPAAYPGICSVEGDRIVVGEMIARHYDGFAHVNCID